MKQIQCLVYLNCYKSPSPLLGKTKIEINENQLAELINLDSLKKQMEKPIAQLKDDYINHLSVRSSAGMNKM